jgi:NifU-like protein involved in Fe-S cluster formation
MAEALYTIDILRLAASTGNWPPLAHPEGSAERRSVTCGSRAAVGLILDDDGRIDAIGLTVSACALGQASSTIMAREAAGKSRADLATARQALANYLRGEAAGLPDWPGMEHLATARAYPARHPSILLPFDAALAAIDDADTARASAHG